MFLSCWRCQHVGWVERCDTRQWEVAAGDAMERQGARFDKDMQDVEFRPHSHCGLSLLSSSRDNDRFAWKLGFAVGISVLAALLIFGAYERHQARRDAKPVLRALKAGNRLAS